MYYIVLYFRQKQTRQIKKGEMNMSYTSKDIKNIVAEILEDKKDKGGVKSLYFVGCGGSLELCILQKHLWRKSVQILNPR